MDPARWPLWRGASSSARTVVVSDATTWLTTLLRERIRTSGPISFHEFMETALYHPIHGYYAAGRARIGRRGDFFTNTSVGSVFGALLARQFAEIWQRLGRPRPFTIIEQGAHSGEFARDVLVEMRERATECFAVIDYCIVEPFPVWLVHQRQALQSFADQVRWAPTLADAGSFCGVHFSNELPDAFPVHAVHWNGKEWLERRVDFQDGRFTFVLAPIIGPILHQRLAQFPAPEGIAYSAEINLAATDWIAQVGTVLREGYVLIIDYGGSRMNLLFPPRLHGTLASYRQHQRQADVLAAPGESDLTAHVDFTTIVEGAEKCGFTLHAYTDQHHFIAALVQQHFGDSPTLTSERQRAIRAVHTLMHPDFMGAVFKVLCLEKAVAELRPLSGFQFAAGGRATLGL